MSLRDKIQEDGKCFLIWFEDAGVHPEVFNDEASARKRFADLRPNWNCYLFQRIADATRTDREE